MLTFRVGAERFGVPAALVREVAPLPRVTRVPHAPDSLIGIGNFRGTVLPIVSFARLADREATRERRVILLDTAQPIALAVDDVTALRQDGDSQVRSLDVEALAAREFGGGQTRRARATASAVARHAEEADSRVSLVVFQVAGQEYALPIACVQEVLKLCDGIALMPQADAVVVGSIAVGDALLPLLSLHALLAQSGTADVKRAAVVVVRIGTHRVGLVVDAMRAIVRATASEIDTVPAVLTRGSAEARIQAICRLEGGRRLVSVLAVEQLLREDLTQRLLQRVEVKMTEKKDAEATQQFLTFRIGDEEFGLPVASVVEVTRLPAKLTKLPKAPAFVQGVMNLRGQVVPVIDQARRFRGAPATGERRRVIVVRLGDVQAGFVVEAVCEVLRVPLASLRAAPELGSEETRVFDRVANLTDTGRLVLIVSPQELLDRAERALLAGLGGKGSAAAS